MPKNVKVIGIDPGSVCLGWGVVEEISGVLKLVACGTIRPKSDSFSGRLGVLFLELESIVKLYKPTEAAIESVFTHKNVMSALKLGQARGAAVAACASNGLNIFDYEPTTIKKALVGVGRAEKQQVSFMVGSILGAKVTWSADAGDALACAICHCNMRRLKSFLK